MKPLTTKDLLAHMPDHVRARVADEIRLLDTPEAEAAFREAQEAIKALQREERARANQRKAGAA